MNMPSEIWLVRHGETEWSQSGQHTSRTDLALTPAGVRQAENLKGMLAGHTFALVLSSPMKRAVDTCHLVGLKPELSEDLREWDYGDYEGLTQPRSRNVFRVGPSSPVRCRTAKRWSRWQLARTGSYCEQRQQETPPCSDTAICREYWARAGSAWSRRMDDCWPFPRHR
jgi:hypothetical protein